MITQEQYQNLKILCKSQNPDDIRIVGPIIANLRRTKQINRQMVNNLFSLMLNKSAYKWYLLERYNDIDRVMKTRFSITGSSDIFSLKELKSVWLNGEL